MENLGPESELRGVRTVCHVPSSSTRSVPAKQWLFQSHGGFDDLKMEIVVENQLTPRQRRRSSWSEAAPSMISAGRGGRRLCASAAVRADPRHQGPAPQPDHSGRAHRRRWPPVLPPAAGGGAGTWFRSARHAQVTNRTRRVHVSVSLFKPLRSLGW